MKTSFIENPALRAVNSSACQCENCRKWFVPNTAFFKVANEICPECLEALEDETIELLRQFS